MRAPSLAAWRAEAPLGFEIHERFVATDRAGNLVAGLAMTEEGRLISTQLVRLPPPLRLANVFLRITPPDGILRQLHIDFDLVLARTRRCGGVPVGIGALAGS